jgi:hypothetical protein
MLLCWTLQIGCGESDKHNVSAVVSAVVFRILIVAVLTDLLLCKF